MQVTESIIELFYDIGLYYLSRLSKELKIYSKTALDIMWSKVNYSEKLATHVRGEMKRNHGTIIEVVGFLSKFPVRRSSIKEQEELNSIVGIVKALHIVHFGIGFRITDKSSGRILYRASQTESSISALNNVLLCVKHYTAYNRPKIKAYHVLHPHCHLLLLVYDRLIVGPSTQLASTIMSVQGLLFSIGTNENCLVRTCDYISNDLKDIIKRYVHFLVPELMHSSYGYIVSVSLSDPRLGINKSICIDPMPELFVNLISSIYQYLSIEPSEQIFSNKFVSKAELRIKPKFDQDVKQFQRTRKLPLANSTQFDKSILKNLNVIGQWESKFILAKICSTDEQNISGLLIFDQHAIHERIRLESMCNIFQRNSNNVGVEKMSIEFKDAGISYSIMSHFLDPINIDLAKNIGLTWDTQSVGIAIFSQSTNLEICCSSYLLNEPLKLSGSEMRSILLDIVNRNLAWKDIPCYLFEIFKKEACHGAIKFGHRLGIDKCKRLLQELQTCKFPFSCAHGRCSMHYIDYGT
jgi:DNA mismatch repair ATPase MutL